MKLFSAFCTILVLALLLTVPAAQAQATRTWVSGVGDDANPCSRTAPCKTFAGAISKTAPGGEISVLDPGGFGAVTITKSITIDGDGTLAGILSSLTNGIIINAAATDDIVIRNISINGIGNGINGIRFLAGKSLTVDHCTISGFTTRGIDMQVGATTRLFVRDTSITKGGTGIFLSATAGQAQASLENVNLTGLTTGLEASTNGRATISNSVLSGDSSNAILVSGTSPRVNLANSQISFDDGNGLNCNSSTGIIRITNNDIFNNGTGIVIAAGCSVETAQNNPHAGDVVPGAPSAVIIPKQ